MGIAARSRRYGINQLRFNDSYVSTRSYTYKGNTTVTQTPVTALNQVVTRSDKLKGALTYVGNKRVRKPTDYQLIVFDRANSDLTTTTKGSAYTDVVTSPYSPDVNVVANATGKFVAYNVSIDTDCDNHAVTKCRNKLGDQKASIGAALAETRSTLEMIGGASTTLFQSYRALRRGRWGESARRLGLDGPRYFSGKSSANLLLQIKYGWLPLMHDIKSGYDWIMDNEDTPLLLRAVANTHREYSGEGNYNSYSRYYWSTSHKATCSITASVNKPALRNANQGGLLNPLAIAWEIVPYSFVLDWWMPVGNVLQAYSDTAGLTFRYGCISSTSEGEVSYGIPEGRRSGSLEYSYSGQNLVDRYYRFRRSAYVSFPIPGIYQKQNWFNMNKGVTALALFRQLFR